MPVSHYHIDRLREQLRHEIGTVIAREMRDPRIPSIVTVTRIKLAQDTRNATVFVSILGDEKMKVDALAALNAAAAYIQRLVSARITVKHFPHLSFKPDNSIEHSQHINELLKEISDDLEQPSPSD
ncbi:MAG: 30S ribosome-binding factor RbfA [Chitinispirillaceae bacterium]|jgi:ribosome-binding factor A